MDNLESKFDKYLINLVRLTIKKVSEYPRQEMIEFKKNLHKKVSDSTEEDRKWISTFMVLIGLCIEDNEKWLKLSKFNQLGMMCTGIDANFPNHTKESLTKEFGKLFIQLELLDPPSDEDITSIPTTNFTRDIAKFGGQ